MTVYDQIKTEFEKQFKSMVFYGESVYKKEQEDFQVYVTVEDPPRACSVNDGYELTCFYFKEAAAANPDGGFGYDNTALRKVQCKMAVNSKSILSEAICAGILNSIPGCEYLSTDFTSESIAQGLFGIPDQNYQTSFFSISFAVTETLICVPCQK